MDKRLYRSRTNSTISGVCGGLGEYFAIDPTFIRIVAVLLALADGIGIVAYIVAWIIIPKEPVGSQTPPPEQTEKKKEEYVRWTRYFPGALLVIIGVFIIVRQYYWWWHIERFWPALLIILGLFLIFRIGNKERLARAGENTTQGGTNEPGKV